MSYHQIASNPPPPSDLSSQYLFPPNNRYERKFLFTRNQLTLINPPPPEKLSPQYLFPPIKVMTTSPEHEETQSQYTKSKKVERYRNIGYQNLSPQYLFPPNLRRASLPLDAITEIRKGAAALK